MIVWQQKNFVCTYVIMFMYASFSNLFTDLNVYLFELKYIFIFLTNHDLQDLFQYLAANNFTFVKKS